MCGGVPAEASAAILLHLRQLSKTQPYSYLASVTK